MPRDVAVDLHSTTCLMVGVDVETAEQVLRRRLSPGETEEYLLGWLQPGDRVVLEATRGSHRFANRLETTGARVMVVDAQQARLLGFRGKKTDYRDCLALLHHLRSGTLVEVWRPDPLTRELRQLGREREGLNKGVVQTKNRIQAVLHEEGARSPGERLWGPEGEAWLREVPLGETHRRSLLRAWRSLQGLLREKAEQEAELCARALHHPQVPRLMQLTGFGPVASLLVLGEIGCWKRFPTSKHLVSYAGLDPCVHQSDQRCQQGAISKAGRASLRWLMVEIAWAHVAGDGPETEHYQRLVRKGKPKNVAIVALARRLLVLAYKLLSGHQNYRELPAQQYLDKLSRLSRARTREEHVAKSHRDWAREEFERLVGPPPEWASRPRSAAKEAPEKEGRRRPSGVRGALAGGLRGPAEAAGDRGLAVAGREATQPAGEIPTSFEART